MRAPRPRSRSPAGFRRRSRSPPPAAQYRGRPRSPIPSGNWRARERSPQGRFREPGPRDNRYVSPPPQAAPQAPRGRYRSRSPLPTPRERVRSPVEYSRGREDPRSNTWTAPTGKRDALESPPPPRERYERPGPPSRRPYVPNQQARQAPYDAPRGGYRERARSPPPREDRYPTKDISHSRPRSPSPVTRAPRAEYRSDHSSGNTSRRSSPPVHPSRLGRGHPAVADPRSSAAWGDGDARHPRSAARSPPRSPYRARSPMQVEQLPPDPDFSPPPRRAYSPHAESPPRGAPAYQAPSRAREYSPPPREDGYYREDDRAAVGHNGYGMADSRGYPDEPPRNYPPRNDASPPVGPSSTSVSMSAHSRSGNASLLAAPRQPRGGPGPRPPPGRESSFSGPYGPGPRRPTPSQYGGPPHSRGPPPRGGHSHGPGRSPPRADSPGSVPTGPRTGPGHNQGHSHGHGPSHGHHMSQYRPSSNTTSRTYPLTQRFSRHLSDLPSIVPGGKLAPSGMDKPIAERLAKLQQEQEKLQKELAEKEEKKRKGLRNWDRMERESARDGLKSELAEQQVKMMAGEGGLGGAAF
ncbi:MAG: hypothetical protein M4579_002382 [Chaenotheca gracillima]|nr:MAG: hypothetical protein M4579_002382 [Chaenotheca gracillima]